MTRRRPCLVLRTCLYKSCAMLVVCCALAIVISEVGSVFSTEAYGIPPQLRHLSSRFDVDRRTVRALAPSSLQQDPRRTDVIDVDYFRAVQALNETTKPPKRGRQSSSGKGRREPLDSWPWLGGKLCHPSNVADHLCHPRFSRNKLAGRPMNLRYHIQTSLPWPLGGDALRIGDDETRHSSVFSGLRVSVAGPAGPCARPIRQSTLGGHTKPLDPLLLMVYPLCFKDIPPSDGPPTNTGPGSVIGNACRPLSRTTSRHMQLALAFLVSKKSPAPTRFSAPSWAIALLLPTVLRPPLRSLRTLFQSKKSNTFLN